MKELIVLMRACKTISDKAKALEDCAETEDVSELAALVRELSDVVCKVVSKQPLSVEG
jgi:hypothetical protein